MQIAALPSQQQCELGGLLLLYTTQSMYSRVAGYATARSPVPCLHLCDATWSVVMWCAAPQSDGLVL